MKKKLAALLALAMSMTMLAACGDSDSSSTPASQPESTPDSSVAETTTAPDSSEAPDETTTAPDSSEAPDETTAPEEPAGPQTEFISDGEDPGDFAAVNFVVDDEGTVNAWIDLANFEPFKETGCTVTFDYSFAKAIDMKDPAAGEKYLEYYLIAPCFASNWAKVYADAPEGTPYMSGISEELDARVAKGGDLKEDWEGQYFMQSDGFFVLCQQKGTETWEWDTNEITFTITPAGIQAMIDCATTNDDGSVYGGLVLQTHGVIVNKLTLSEPAAE